MQMLRNIIFIYKQSIIIHSCVLRHFDWLIGLDELLVIPDLKSKKNKINDDFVFFLSY